jgi:hypothetical protein
VKIAVVTPYFREADEVLARCLDSVAAQTHPATHVVVADGFPNPLVDAYPDAVHLKLSQSHADNGDTPRGIGAQWALEAGFDAIAFLDADNWYRPRHLQNLANLHKQSGAEVLIASRSFHRADGTELAGVSEAGDGVHYADTSCLMLAGRALQIAPLWAAIPTRLSPICDRIFWQMLSAHGFRTAHCHERTVAFVTQYVAHYLAAGEIPPAGAKDASQSQEAAAWWNALPLAEQARLNRIMGFP